MAGAKLHGMDGLTGLGVECENCGRRKRLTRPQIKRMLGSGIHTVEQLGQKLQCRACAERGKFSKNVTVTPYYKAETAGVIHDRPSASSQGITR